MMRVSVASLAVLAACGTKQPSSTIPLLEVLTPERGTFLEGGQITVTGRVQDDGPVRVTVNGVEAEVANGMFTANVVATRGLAILETHAIDASGNDVRDVRAVLAGTLAPSDATSKAPLGARLGRRGLTTLGDALGTSAEAIDFTAAAKALNPVYDNGGCLGAKVNITSVSVQNIEVTMIPKTGAIDTSVVLENVVVKLDADFKAACIGGSTTITVRSSKARVRDDLSATLVTGKIRTALPSPTVTLEGFTVDVGGVPGAVEDLLRGQARAGAEKAITSAIKTKVPPMADQKLGALLGQPLATSLLGQELAIDMTPEKLEITDAGIFAVVDTSLVIAGGEGGMFVSTPAAIATVTHDVSSIGVLISDDTVNQLFAGLWATRAFERSLSIDAIGPAAALLDDDVRSLDVKLSLPPTVNAGDTLELAIGDLIITARDGSGAEVQTFALSLRTTLAARAGATPTLVTTKPTIYAQMLVQTDAVENPLEATEIEGIVGGVWGLVDGMVNDALAKVPMPSVGGVTFEAPAVSSRDGFLVLDAGAQ